MTGGRTTISIHGALQVLRPPQDGLPYLRHHRAGELMLEPGALSIEGERIAAFEPDQHARIQVDASDCALVPGFVDCHTHLPFAGWRAGEYELKVTGVPYEEIARRGGGIASSARALAKASDAAVVRQARGTAMEMLRHGTTALECKSGYGLSVGGELRALKLAARMDAVLEQRTVSTALLAHAVPEGYDADGWMDEVEAMLPRVVGETRARAVDIYVESVAFSNAHLERLGRLAKAHDLWLRAHVEQFACHRSVPVALAAGARSVDHLAELHRDDLEPLAQAECAAVMLPAAELLGAEHLAPARALADAGAICAIATDCNPGTSPVASLPLIIGLAVRMYGWTAREALLACTLNAAWVLGLEQELGSLEAGKRADVLVLDSPVEHLPYRFGRNAVAVVLCGGTPVWVRPDQSWRVSGL